LIEKEWCATGHQFELRCGHGRRTDSENQRSPIFLQFIDCVYQLIEQFPASFEFNEKFLIAILDALYSCRYGTFLCNSEAERRENNLTTKTVSLWTDLLKPANIVQFLNPKYVNPFESNGGPDKMWGENGSHLLLAMTDLRFIKFWVREVIIMKNSFNMLIFNSKITILDMSLRPML
jgi:hypothetical protein